MPGLFSIRRGTQDFVHIKCGSLNVIGPHKFMESGTIRGCDLIEISVALLEEVCHCGALRFPMLNLSLVSSLPVTYGSRCKLSAPSPAPCLPACRNNNGLTSKTVSLP